MTFKIRFVSNVIHLLCYISKGREETTTTRDKKHNKDTLRRRGSSQLRTSADEIEKHTTTIGPEVGRFTHGVVCPRGGMIMASREKNVPGCSHRR